METGSNRKKTVLVTGANRGLGLETCRQLRQQGCRVLLSSRNQAQAEQAAQEVGADPLVLDVTDDASVERAAAEAQSKYAPLDGLVNNAGVALDGFDAHVARQTVEVNYRGCLRVTRAFRPLLAESATIVMVSSGLGELAGVSEARQKEFTNPERTEGDIDRLMNAFLGDVAADTVGKGGWPRSAYRVSKLGLNSWTRLYASRPENQQLRINAICPGWVRTDMGGPNAARSVKQGAEGIVWAALLPSGGPSGGFFRDGKPIDW